MAAVQEYYVSCNPPLLPNAVSRVIEEVRELFGEDLLEILYEPDIPWFKCISNIYAKPKICAEIEARLCTIVGDNVDTIDGDTASEGDIAIISEDPEVVPWIKYSSADWRSFAFPDDAVFPEPISSMKYKTLWRGLETSHKRLAPSQLFAKCSEIFGQDFAISSEAQGDTMYGCLLSYNLSYSLVYIGSNESESALELAITKLATWVDIYNSIGKSAHSIIVTNLDDCQFAYKRLLHVDMLRTTYLRSDFAPIDEYQVLLEAVAIQTKVLTQDGTWKFERDKFPKTNSSPPSSTRGTNFVYPTRVSQHIKSAVSSTTNLLNLVQTNSIQSWRDDVIKESTDESKYTDTSLPQPASRVIDLLDDMPQNDELIALIPCEKNNVISALGSGDMAALEDMHLDAHDLLTPSLNKPPASESKPQFYAFPSTNQEDLISFEEVGEESLTKECLAQAPAASNSAENANDNDPQTILKHARTAESLSIPARSTSRKLPFHLRDAILQLKTAASVFETVPGQISLRLSFGRIYLKHLSSTVVDFENTIQFAEEKILAHLGRLSQDNVGFTPILSTTEADMSCLPLLRTLNSSKWDIVEKKLYYDLSCEFEPGIHVDVEVDPEAGTSAYNRQSELFTTFFHCPSLTWDMKASGLHSVNVSQKYSEWLQSWLKCVKASVCVQGRLRLEFEDNLRDAAVIKAVKARHVTIYGNQIDSMLEVAVHRNLYKKKNGSKPKSPDSKIRVTWEMPAAWHSAKGNPDQWMEAYLKSEIAEKAFQSNMDLQVGSRTSWTVDQLENAGVFADLCQVGFEMASQMNDIGLHNNNGAAMNMAPTYADATRALGTREAVAYW